MDVDRARALTELRLEILRRDEAMANALGTPSIAACLAIRGSLEARIAPPLAA